MTVTMRCWIIEFRTRQKGLTKNGVRHRWSRWRFYNWTRHHDLALRNRENIRRRAHAVVPGIYGPVDAEARIVAFDRRRRGGG